MATRFSVPTPARQRALVRCAVLATTLVTMAACGRPADHAPRQIPSAPATPASTPIALSPDGRTVWVANPDADTVTPVAVDGLVAGEPLPVGDEPWGVAVAPDGTVVVLNRAAGSLTFLEGGRRTDLAVGPEPGGVALAPSGDRAYVTISSADELAVVDVAARRVTDRVPVGRLPWALAVVGDGTVVVTHRLARLRPGGAESADDGKEGWLTVVRDGVVTEVALPPHDFGFPNAFEAVAVAEAADGDAVLHLGHLLNSPEPPNDFQTTVSAGLTTVALDERRELPSRRVHINEPGFSTPVSFPRALALGPTGTMLYVALAGSDVVMGVDLSEPEAPVLAGFWPTGANPRGLVVDAKGERAYVMNHLSRDVSVLDVSDASARREIARVEVTGETLDPVTLRGLRLFNHAADPRVSRMGWLACASCHYDGGTDGTTWQLGEGPRQTMPLWALDGTAPLHVAATRDEAQDFEADIESLMGGVGLAPARANPLLGNANGGTSEDLDALAAYVLRGIRVPRAPAADAGRASRGRALFDGLGCVGCHGGPAWTISSLPAEPGSATTGGDVVGGSLYDVGTFDPDRDVTGSAGFDPPGLMALHATSPYLHDGRATTLEALLSRPDHPGVALAGEELAALAAFLRSIDGTTVPFAAE